MTRLRLHGADAALVLALFAGNLLIAGRFLVTGFSSQVWNNEYSYISIARFFRYQPWTWNPAWYGGMPFHYVYPPLFHLLVALTPGSSLGHSFHLVTAVVYALTPVAVYWLGLQLFGTRLPAALAAVAYSVFPAPIYALSDFRGIGAGFAYAPWSFVAMAGYAAGPNLLALAEAILAVGLAWKQRWVATCLALAAVLLTQWSAAAGAAIALVCVAIAQYRTLGLRETVQKYCFVFLAACGLAAFWLTPGAVRSAWMNLRALSAGEHPAAWGWKTMVMIALGLAVLALAAWRRVPPLAAFFLAWLALVGAPMVAFQLERTQVLPFTWRMSMELNVALVLVLAGCALALHGAAARTAVILAALAVVVCAGIPFLSKAWRLQPAALVPASSAAFQASEWLRQNSQGSRVFVSGELSLSLNAWTDVRQAGGGADQSPSNPAVLGAYHQLPNTCGAEAARATTLWLAALGCRYIVVHGATSNETYHWFADTARFEPLPVAWSNGAGDTVYRVPQASDAEASVVDRRALAALPPFSSVSDTRFLEQYTAWAGGVHSASLRWIGNDQAEIEADVGEGQAVLVRSNYDPGWRARGVRIAPDPIGFLLLDLPAGHHRLALRYGAPAEVWFGRGVTVLVLLLLVFRRPRKGTRPSAWPGAGQAGGLVPAAAVSLLAIALTAVAAAGDSPAARAAQAAFARSQPPIISPAAIVQSGTLAPPPLSRRSPITIFARNLGGPGDQVRVWAGTRPAALVGRGENYIEARLPEDLGERVELSIEVNGCRGNAYQVRLRD